MLTKLIQRLIPYRHVNRPNSTKFMDRRGISTIAAYRSFPATLMRLNAGVLFKPLPCEEQWQSSQLSFNTGHEKSEDWTHYLGMLLRDPSYTTLEADPAMERAGLHR